MCEPIGKWVKLACKGAPGREEKKCVNLIKGKTSVRPICKMVKQEGIGHFSLERAKEKKFLTKQCLCSRLSECHNRYLYFYLFLCNKIFLFVKGHRVKRKNVNTSKYIAF
jgi:hypothetical protein